VHNPSLWFVPSVPYHTHSEGANTHHTNHRIKPACCWTPLTLGTLADMKPSRLSPEKLHSSHRGRHPLEHHRHKEVHTNTQPETEAITESVNGLLVSRLCESNLSCKREVAVLS